MQHTPGPFSADADVEGVILAPDGKQVASVFPRDREGNMALFLSAPDLLAALESIVNSEWRTAGNPLMEGDVVATPDMVEAAKAAIKRARGE